MSTLHGWLLDLFPGEQDGLVLWLLEQGGARLRLRQDFPARFYAAGPPERLRALWKFLRLQASSVKLERAVRRDLFQPAPLQVLAAQVGAPAQLAPLFARVSAVFPDLTYYDADIPFALRHAAVYGTFPLAQLRLEVDGDEIHALEVLDSPWDLDPPPAPLRVMRLEPDADPRRSQPQSLKIHAGRCDYRLGLQPARPLLVNLAALLQRHDPDLILSAWGDTWLLPYLLELSQELGLELPLNREPGKAALHRPERSYQAYGRVIHRGRQVYLFGRWHIDIYNAMMFHDYGLAGVLESARVSATPVQQAARLSPGSGISAMQVATALRQGVMTPWRKQQAEMNKSALDLLRADQGGLVYQPLVGLHHDVAEIDFISMYPAIMARFNVSPETVAVEPDAGAGDFELVPELNLHVERSKPGLIPQTLRPLLEKRIALKGRLAELPSRDSRRAAYKAQAAAHKWLLVTCFGYLGYKNARFGRIEAHQAVTAYSRECLLRAKEAAEDAGFTVLHMYVDGLWVHKPGCRSVAEVQPLLDEIAARTGLSIALEGIYRWLAFLPSRVDGRVPVANRYFGVFQDGSLKLRGIEARRGDTPPFIARAQVGLLERLAQAPEAAPLEKLLSQLMVYLRGELARLRQGRVPLADLLVTQTVSRELAAYRAPSPAARAAMQLQRAGKTVRPGQAVKFLYTLGEPGVHAWDCPPPPPAACLNLRYYRKLFLRAAAAVLQPLGVSAAELDGWLCDGARYLAAPGRLPLLPGGR